MSPRALSLRQKASLALLLMRNASTAMTRDIGSGTTDVLGGAEEEEGK
jgi:hypothetical protein